MHREFGLNCVYLLQARRLWEAILYAQPKVRTDQGLASLAQQVTSDTVF